MFRKFNNTTFYEIYPNNFCDSNGDGYGDLKGIISKLDYVKSLGVGGIWFNPFYESPFLDGGYDISDYYKIKDRFGTMDDFYELLNEVHKRDMLFLMDLVPGHVSIYNKDFIRSAEGTPNEMYDTFIWTDDPWCWYTDCAPIRGCYDRSGAYIVNFFAHQAAINYGYNKITHKSWQIPTSDKRSNAGRIYLEKIMRFWLDKGIDGFRVDMADSLVKNDGTTKHETIKLWQQIRKDLEKDYPNMKLTSEWCNPSQACQAGFNSDFVLDHNDNFSHYLFRERDKQGNNIPLLHQYDETLFNKFVKNVNKWIRDAKKYHGQISVISGNHDTERLANFLTKDELRNAFIFILTMPGVPYIYAGDEIGMYQDRTLPSIEGGFQRTGCRTPMRFDHSKNYGFSTADKTFLPTNEQSTTVLDEENNPNSLLNLIKQLIELRNNDETLSNDNFKFIKDIQFGYERDNHKVFIAINGDIEYILQNNEKVVLLNNDARVDGNKVIIPHHSAAIIHK